MNKSQLGIAMYTKNNIVQDSGFIYSAWSGLQTIKQEYGIRAMIADIQNAKEAGEQLDAITGDGYKLVWILGSTSAETIIKEAEKYPDITFACIDIPKDIQLPKNVLGIEFREQEGAFLAGYLAAKVILETGSAQKHIGFVGGEKIPHIRKFEYGYKAGAWFADTEIKVDTAYTDSFVSEKAGKRAANTVIDNGCNILFHAAGASGRGVIQAANDRGQKVLGADIDQGFIAPETVVSSVLKNVGKIIYQISAHFIQDDIIEMGTRSFGISDGGINISPITNVNHRKDLQEDVERISGAIVNGTIHPPATAKELRKF